MSLEEAPTDQPEDVFCPEKVKEVLSSFCLKRVVASSLLEIENILSYEEVKAGTLSSEDCVSFHALTYFKLNLGKTIVICEVDSFRIKFYDDSSFKEIELDPERKEVILKAYVKRN